MDRRRRLALIALIVVVVAAAVVALGVGVGGWRFTRSDKASPSPSYLTGATLPGGGTTGATLPGGGSTTPETGTGAAGNEPCNRVGWLLPCPNQPQLSGPAILPGKVSVSEGAAGTTTLSLPVRLSNRSRRTVTVNWRTLFLITNPPLRDEASPTSDYRATLGTVTFAPGQTLKTVRVIVTGDTSREPDEFIVISFVSPKNARLGGIFGLGGGVIVNDD